MPVTLNDKGASNWANYIDYWREEDAEWMQKRMVLRYDNAAQRDADAVAGPTDVGRLNYRFDTDRLELRAAAGWIKYDPLPVNLRASQDTPTQVSLVHTAAGTTSGISITPADVQLVGRVSLPSLLADATGVTIKVGSNKAAKLTTDATNLISDTPVTIPGGTFTALLNAASLTIPAGGTLTAPTGNFTIVLTTAALTVNGAITAAGVGHLLGGVVFPGSGRIAALPGASGLNGGGYVSGQGYFYGDSSSAVVRQRDPSTGAWGATLFQVFRDKFEFRGGGECYMDSQLRIASNRSILWDNSGMTSGPNVWSATDPGAANFPDGTLWIQT